MRMLLGTKIRVAVTALMIVNVGLVTMFPSPPAFAFTALFWIFAGGCFGFYHVVSTTPANGSSSGPSIPPYSE